MAIELSGADGDLPEGYVAIIVSRYNDSITSKLLSGALETLQNGGFDEERIVVVEVPGAWELVLPSLNMAISEAICGVIALGAVIRGETTHDQHINRAVTTALINASVDADTPIALGLLTCENVEQAIQRSGGNMGNKGIEAAEALLEMLRLGVKMQALLGDGSEEEAED
ncbi:6,7-dimethyl-8-ribityllumazine synthase [Candidatus Laterigemmans baculatus]|uniref:6,7-dimethyl-8-ribityllumazine synthase n=1 Tax=Candidatus Laterigemmans baculatus TaxID=2770505 RepID=UPI0013DCE125